MTQFRSVWAASLFGLGIMSMTVVSPGQASPRNKLPGGRYQPARRSRAKRQLRRLTRQRAW